MDNGDVSASCVIRIGVEWNEWNVITQGIPNFYAVFKPPETPLC